MCSLLNLNIFTQVNHIFLNNSSLNLDSFRLLMNKLNSDTVSYYILYLFLSEILLAVKIKFNDRKNKKY